MKLHHLKALCLISVILLLTGCGTSRIPDSDGSSPQVSTWEDLTLPTASATPSAGVVMPELSAPAALEEDDVTDSYKDLFVGIWDNEDGSRTYDFRSNENLVLTNGSGDSRTYTYWFLDNGKQIRLCIF